MNHECTATFKESHKMMKSTDVQIKIIAKVSDVTLKVS